jgi:hypothetical protein
MKPSELIPALKVSLEKKWPMLIIGKPGAGKSDIVSQVVKDLQYDLQIEHAVTSDSVDMKGLPAIVNGFADFMPYGSLRRMMETKTPLTVFFDDIGQAPNSVQASLMQVLLAREVTGNKISDHVRFCACTNGRTDNAGVSGIITPLINRFRSVITLDVDANDWCAWAMNNNVPLELISFLQFRPELISTFDPKKSKNIEPFASPRSITFLGDWINQNIFDLGVWTGCVGQAFATEFNGFFKIYKEVGTLIPQILTNPKKAPIQEKPDQHYAVCAALAYKASDVNIDAIGEYAERFKQREYATFIFKCITARNKELCNTRCYQKWALLHFDELQ